MPYSKQTWSDNNPTYPLSAARMGVIEQGIYDAAAVADQGHRVLSTSGKNALTGVVAGTQVYDSTLGQLQVYNGSQWVASSGLVPIICTGYTTPKMTFTAAQATTIQGAFSSLYEWHRIIFNMTHTTTNNSDMFMQLLDGSNAVIGTNTHSYALMQVYVGASGFGGAAATSYWQVGQCSTGNNSSAVIDVYGAGLAASKAATIANVHSQSGTAIDSRTAWAKNSTATAATGFQFWVTGAITGSVTVYGYNRV